MQVSNEAKEDPNTGEGKLKYNREKDDQETKVQQPKMLTEKSNFGGSPVSHIPTQSFIRKKIIVREKEEKP